MNSVRVIKSIQELEEFVTNFSALEFAADTETTALETHKLELVCISLYCPSLPEPVVIPFNFSASYLLNEREGRKIRKVKMGYRATDRLDWEAAKPLIRKLFQGKRTIWANAKFDRKVAIKYGWDCYDITDDTQIMAYLIDPDQPTGLKDNAVRHLKVKMTSYAETTGMKDGNIIWPQVKWKDYFNYAGRDSWATYYLRDHFLSTFRNDEKLNTCYRRIELPLVKVLAKSEHRGVKIDQPYMRKLGNDVRKEIGLLEERIFEEVGERFNLGSGKQLAVVLFDNLKYPVISKTNSGDRSTDEATLKELSFRGYKVADLIVKHRELNKLLGTYIDNIFEMLDEDGALHGSFNATFTRTGRMSSSNPNLQNQPNNKKFPVRRGYVPRPGYCFLIFDWSNIEIRMMAHISRDPLLISVLRNGQDVHQTTTDNINRLYNIGIDRQDGKTVNFSSLYGVGADKLAGMLNSRLRDAFNAGKITKDVLDRRWVSKEMAQKMIDGYFATYVGFTNWGHAITAKVKETGWIYTIGGRRRRVDELKHRETFYRGKRIVINTDIQGSSADLMKLGAVLLDDYYVETGIDALTLLYVHDEFVIECRKKDAKRAFIETKRILENLYPQCLVPIIAEGVIAMSWDEKKGGAKKQALTPVELLTMNLLKL